MEVVVNSSNNPILLVEYEYSIIDIHVEVISNVVTSNFLNTANECVEFNFALESINNDLSLIVESSPIISIEQTNNSMLIENMPVVFNSIKSWIYYVSGWSIVPQFLANITDGTVYEYVVDGQVIYRFVPSIYLASLDRFYREFNGVTLSDLIVARG